MASQVDFDGALQRMAVRLAAMREDLQPPAGVLREVAGDMQLTSAEVLVLEEFRLKEWVSERPGVEETLAQMITALASEIDAVRSEFDNREAPTSGEKLVGYLSKPAMRRRQVARWRSPVPRNRLAELVKRADGLFGLLSEERGYLADQRKESEGNLVRFISHRTEMIARLRGEDGQAMSRLEAIRQTERFVGVFQMLVDALNAGLRTCNILLHKLGADLEDLLVLYKIVSDESGRDQVVTLTVGGFPHIGDAISRFSSDKLLVHDIERRKQVANLTFFERFEGPPEHVSEVVVAPA
jgi:hypothetical protein